MRGGEREGEINATKYPVPMNMEEMIIAYLSGDLTEAESREVERRIAESKEWARAAEAYALALNAVKAPVADVPSGQLRAGFDRFLAEQAAGRVSNERNLMSVRYWRAAAAVALVVIGAGFGVLWRNNLSQKAQIAELRGAMEQTQKMLVLSMLEQNSASERIRALNIGLPASLVDRQVLDAFLATLNSDKNVNVRIKAAEALATFRGEPHAVEGLIKALNHQEDPAVQITIIDLLVEMKAKNASEAFRQLARRDNILDIVREKAKVGMKAL